MRTLWGLALTALSFVTTLHAKNLGVHAQTFPIAEASLLDVMLERLHLAKASGALDTLNKEFVERVKESALNPQPVSGLIRATFPRTVLHDPSLHITQDVKDHEGRLIAGKGTIINPLDTLSWGEPLLLVDARDEEQVAWAQKELGKITLVGGSSLQLEESLNRPVYFDQGGTITRRFGIRAVPARVSQAGNRLKIEEIALVSNPTVKNRE